MPQGKKATPRDVLEGRAKSAAMRPHNRPDLPIYQTDIHLPREDRAKTGGPMTKGKTAMAVGKVAAQKAADPGSVVFPVGRGGERSEFNRMPVKKNRAMLRRAPSRGRR